MYLTFIVKFSGAQTPCNDDLTQKKALTIPY